MRFLFGIKWHLPVSIVYFCVEPPPPPPPKFTEHGCVSSVSSCLKSLTLSEATGVPFSVMLWLSSSAGVVTEVKSVVLSGLLESGVHSVVF